MSAAWRASNAKVSIVCPFDSCHTWKALHQEWRICHDFQKCSMGNIQLTDMNPSLDLIYILYTILNSVYYIYTEFHLEPWNWTANCFLSIWAVFRDWAPRLVSSTKTNHQPILQVLLLSAFDLRPDVSDTTSISGSRDFKDNFRQLCFWIHLIFCCSLWSFFDSVS